MRKNRGQESVCRLVEVGLCLTGGSLAEGISRGEVDRSRKGGKRVRAAASGGGELVSKGSSISTSRHEGVIAIRY